MELSTSGDLGAGFVRVRDGSHVGRARRLVREMVEKAELGTELAERAALVATELSTNLSTHARGGELHVRVRDEGVDLVSVDLGPGMRDLERAFRDALTVEDTAGLGIVEVLFTDVSVRGTGIGGLLLDTAVAWLREQGRIPVLDVVTDHGTAHAATLPVHILGRGMNHNIGTQCEGKL